MFPTRKKGTKFEQLARQYLQQQGLKLIEQNYYCRFGEIDLIMSDEQTVCFIEVRYRQRQDYGGSAYSITAAKQARISKTALHYMSRQPSMHRHCYRFDALLIDGNEPSPGYQWLKNCFEPVADGYF